MKKIAVAIIILGLACLAMGVICKVFLLGHIVRFSPTGFGQGAVILFLLSLNLLILDKKS